uniref:Uncharacterized protein n=1 Tax=Oryza brachyantha TaxID=4533 RepID=J3MPY7_ORYBR
MYTLGSTSLLSSSAVDLAQTGIKLTASTAEWFGDMISVGRWAVTGELSLSPMFLNNVTSSWLVNIAALEESGAADATTSVVSSYLSVMAMLMDGEEDVQQLRAKEVLYSTISNTQTLEFFKRIGQHLGFRELFSIPEEVTRGMVPLVILETKRY